MYAVQEVIAKLKEVLKQTLGVMRATSEFANVGIDYAGQLSVELIGAKNFDSAEWNKVRIAF